MEMVKLDFKNNSVLTKEKVYIEQVEQIMNRLVQTVRIPPRMFRY